MSALILPSRFRQQPQYPASIDWGNPLTKGLVSAPSFATGIDSVTRKPLTVTGTVTKVATAAGVGAYCTGGSYVTVDTPVGIGTVPPGVTVFVVLQPVSFASYGAIYETNGDSFQLSASTGGGGVFNYRGINAATGNLPTNGSALIAGMVNTFAYAAGYSSSTDHVYVNGIQGSSGICGTGSNTRSTLSFGIGNGGYANPDNIYLQAFVFNRPLSSGEILSLHQNPWQIFKATPRFYFAPSGGPTAYTLPADSGTFALTGTDATLARSRVLPADAASFALTGTAATLAYGRVLSADSGAFALSGTAATLEYTPAGGPTYTLTADSGSFAATGTAAVLAVGHVLSVNAGSIVLTGTNATLLANRVLSAGSGNYALTGTGVTLSAPAVLHTDSGSFVLTGTDVTLTFGAAIIVPVSGVWTKELDIASIWTKDPINSSTWTKEAGI